MTRTEPGAGTTGELVEIRPQFGDGWGCPVFITKTTYDELRRKADGRYILDQLGGLASAGRYQTGVVPTRSGVGKPHEFVYLPPGQKSFRRFRRVDSIQEDGRLITILSLANEDKGDEARANRSAVRPGQRSRSTGVNVGAKVGQGRRLRTRPQPSAAARPVGSCLVWAMVGGCSVGSLFGL